jgi:hypothetical protein
MRMKVYIGTDISLLFRNATSHLAKTSIPTFKPVNMHFLLTFVLIFLTLSTLAFLAIEVILSSGSATTEIMKCNQGFCDEVIWLDEYTPCISGCGNSSLAVLDVAPVVLILAKRKLVRS